MKYAWLVRGGFFDFLGSKCGKQVVVAHSFPTAVSKASFFVGRTGKKQHYSHYVDEGSLKGHVAVARKLELGNTTCLDK